MKSLWFFVGLLVVTAGASFAQFVASDPEAIEIKLRYQPGKTYETVSEVTTTTQFDMGGELMNNDQVMTFVVENAVSAVEGSDDIGMSMTYTRVAMIMDAMGERIVYDSAVESETEEGEDESPMKMMSDLVGKKVALVISPDMEIKKIDGLDDILKGGEDEGIPDEMMDDVKKEHVKQLSGLSFAAMMPAKPVKEGDEWTYTDEETTAMLGNLEIKGTSTLREVGLVGGRLQAVVELTAKGKSVVKEEGAEVAVQPVLGAGGQVKKLDITGEIVIDIDGGYVVGATIENDIIMTLDMGDGAAVMELPIKSSAKLTTSIK